VAEKTAYLIVIEKTARAIRRIAVLATSLDDARAQAAARVERSPYRDWSLNEAAPEHPIDLVSIYDAGTTELLDERTTLDPTSSDAAAQDD
jgi:hypothetical protein